MNLLINIPLAIGTGISWLIGATICMAVIYVLSSFFIRKILGKVFGENTK